MKLYNLSAGMNPRRVRIFLAEKGVSIPLHEVDVAKNENATPEFLAINPMGKLPVLELDDGTILTESIAICRYIEAQHAEPNMFGTTALETAQIEMWARRAELEMGLQVMQVFANLHPFWEGRIKQVKEYGELAREKLLQRMDWLNGELANRAPEDREFLVAGRYTIADIILQCALIVGKACQVRIPEEHDHLANWFAGVTSRPSARA
ncbi:MAG: glutathione S-transferase family protein [Gammaproteobacteria bacterium]|jgi:glutathione S-transferase|nr:glutathione S-transferase family protein [Gammaproteobacteria bacterium]